MSSIWRGLLCAGFVAVLLIGRTANAQLSLNIGYQNPVEANFGANILYTWTDWAAELGVGFLGSGKNNADKSALRIGGDLDLKYMFLGGSLRPFLQSGMYWDFSSTLSDNDLNFGNKFFAGAGFFVFGSGVYSYASYNTGPPGWFLQAGLGFNF